MKTLYNANAGYRKKKINAQNAIRRVFDCSSGDEMWYDAGGRYYRLISISPFVN